MHNAAYAELGIDAVFLAFDVSPPALKDAFAGARAMGLRQLSVSIPHKVAALECVDVLDDSAARIGALNTAILEQGRWRGHNTDGYGAIRALERETSLSGRRAVVLGAGGTGRAVAYGLVESGAEVRVLNRTVARAESLAKDVGAAGFGPLEALADLEHEVLINTTSVGLDSNESPVDAAALRRNTVVLDAVYQPEETRLLRDARARGARTIPGKWMLVYQAAEQLRLWSGATPPIEAMARAFDLAGSTQRE
jgi:shikimate dehydrogenase